MKRFLPLFCLEMLTVLLIAYNVYRRWDYPLLFSIGLVIAAAVLLLVFHTRYEKLSRSRNEGRAQ